jgi:hypothetical protein
VCSNDGKVQEHDGTRKGNRSDQSAPKFPVEVFLLQDSSPALGVPVHDFRTTSDASRSGHITGVDKSTIWPKEAEAGKFVVYATTRTKTCRVGLRPA